MARNLKLICLILYCNDRFIAFRRWDTFIHFNAFCHIIRLKCNFAFNANKETHQMIFIHCTLSHNLQLKLKKVFFFQKSYFQNIRLFWFVKYRRLIKSMDYVLDETYSHDQVQWIKTLNIEIKKCGTFKVLH